MQHPVDAAATSEPPRQPSVALPHDDGSVPPPAADVRSGILVGAALVGVLTVPKLAFVDVIGTPTPYLLYFAAILAAAFRGGLVAGLVATGLSALLGVSIFVRDPWLHPLSVTLPQVAVFGIEGYAIAYVTSRFVRARRRALRAAEASREAADRLTGVVQALGEGITVQDAAGRLIFANELAARLSGFASAEEMLALPPSAMAEHFELFDADGRPFPFSRLPGRVLLAGGTPEPVTIRFRTRNGRTERWSRVRANAVYDDEGRPRLIVNAFQDVTELHNKDHALELSREWFQIALRSIGDAVISTDAEGRVNLLNPVAEALTGHANQASLGKPLPEVFRIIREDTRAPAENPVDRVIREGVVVGLSNHTLLVRADGTEVSIDDSAAPIRDVEGKLAGVILVFRDVSAKRAGERRTEFLVRATQELNSSLDHRVTLATVARLAVPAMADWCAVDVVEDGKRRRLAVAHVDPAKVEWVKEIERRYPPDPEAPRGVPNILRTGKPEMLEEIPKQVLEASARDEEHRQIIEKLDLHSYIGVPLAHDGRIFGVVSLVMAESRRRYGPDDLAMASQLADRAAVAIEKARLFAEAQRARSEAENATRTKDEFLAMLGHELRNPLAPIRTALDLMRHRPGADHQREYRVIERQMDHVLALIDDLLDVSRITRGRIELRREPVRLRSAVERAYEQVFPGGTEPEQTVSSDVPPELVVSGDAVRLAQVVANLLSNAVKHTPKAGRIAIEGRRTGDFVELRVKDDGDGIAPETLERVFDIFVQGPQALDRARGGLGLGLTIVQGLVQAHGGTVAAKSDGPDRGAEFVVRLPALDDADEPTRESSPEVVRPEPTRVLIVDDNADELELLAELLSLSGLDPLKAADAEEAITVARETVPRVALVDIGLPGVDGYELARRLRSLPELANLRLVAVTGYGQDSDRKRSAAAGFSAHLVKPVGVGDLLRTIADVQK